VGSAARCQLEADTKDQLLPFSNSKKEFFLNIVSQEEFEAG
jgi:hypothetical protein